MNQLATVDNAVAIPMDQLQRMAKAMADSKLFGIANVDQALSLMLVAQAEGRHPALAARDYHIINNRPSLKADTLLSRFQAAGGSVKWLKYEDAVVAGVFTHPQSGSVTVEWDEKRAQKAGLWGKDNWKSYPRAMLRSRVISEGVRTCFPGVAVGVYTPEEITSGNDEIDVTPQTVSEAVQSVADKSTALTQDEIEQHIDAMMEAGALPDLDKAYMAGREHAKQAKDKAARDKFSQVREMRAEFIKGMGE